MFTRFRFRPVSFYAVNLCLALMVGCSSEPHPERPDGPAAAMRDFPPAMTGTENFADGKVAVQVTLGLPGAFRGGEEGERRGSGPRPGGRRSGSHGGSMGMGGPGGMHGGGEMPDGVGGEGDRPQPTMRGSNLPPAQLKLHLQNLSSTDAVVCEVVDFNSSLGNFAVYPSRYQIEAGQTVSSETMTSRLGVEGGEIPVTVSLRVNDHVEKKVITLRVLPAPAKAETEK